MRPTLLYRVWKTGAVSTTVMPESVARELVARFQTPHLRYAAVTKKVGKFTVALTIHGDHRTYCHAALTDARRRFNPEE